MSVVSKRLLPLLTLLFTGCAIVDAVTGDPDEADMRVQSDMAIDLVEAPDMDMSPDLDISPDMDMMVTPDMAPDLDMMVIPDMASERCEQTLSPVNAIKCSTDVDMSDSSPDSLDMDADAGDMAAPLSALQVEASLGFSCALLSDRSVRCWGANDERRLGLNVTRNAPQDRIAELPLNIKQIALGARHGCAVTESGEVYCWGSNSNGQRGDGTNVPIDQIATPVAGLSGVSKVTAGEYFNCALLNIGEVRCWGRNRYGQIGIGNSSELSPTPQSPDGLTGVVDIDAGENHVCAALADGSVRCWGRSEFGESGVLVADRITRPNAIEQLDKVHSITTGSGVSCAVRGAGCEGGSLYCWGMTHEARPTICTTIANRHKAIPVANIAPSPIIASAGRDVTCAVLADKSVWCWGFSQPFNYTRTPTKINGLQAVSQISVGGVGDNDNGSVRHICALSEGNILCWGDNSRGQLGRGTTGGAFITPAVVALPQL